ncbi:hypothetical protein FQN50_000259 [Emmonsiellopsis sp. PD_5]|nr:hypothetical protein FQN50_000259 [Emmonsiellopsis sp. PD_5]
MPEEVKGLLDKDKMERGVAALDEAMGKDPLIYAYSPITMISPGGYPAVTYFRNRATTEDIDIIIDPEHASDKDIADLIHEKMTEVGEGLGLGRGWMNDAVNLFLTKEARQSLFKDAEQQNIVLWGGENLKILAPPLAWGIETKLRRLTTKPGHHKMPTDVEDILVMLNTLIGGKGVPLKRQEVQAWNRNGFDVMIKGHVLDMIAEAYQSRYGMFPFC